MLQIFEIEYIRYKDNKVIFSEIEYIHILLSIVCYRVPYLVPYAEYLCISFLAIVGYAICV